MNNHQIIEILEMHLLQQKSTLACFYTELSELKIDSLCAGNQELYDATCKFLTAIVEYKASRPPHHVVLNYEMHSKSSLQPKCSAQKHITIFQNME